MSNRAEDDSTEPAAVERVSRRRLRVEPLSLGVAGLWILLDQITKSWAVARLTDGRVIDVVGSLRFNLSFNSGMAFGRGQGLGPVIGVVALVVVVVLLVGLRVEGSRLGVVAVGLVVGGAAGNVVDRLFRGEAWFRGAVVDFIDLQWWPVFNIADIGVTVGGLLLVVSSVWGPRRRAA
jgi:signal peptidase II